MHKKMSSLEKMVEEEKLYINPEDLPRLQSHAQKAEKAIVQYLLKVNFSAEIVLLISAHIVLNSNQFVRKSIFM